MGKEVWVVTANLQIPQVMEDESLIIGVFSSRERAEEAGRDTVSTFPGAYLHPSIKFGTEVHCYELDDLLTNPYADDFQDCQ